MARPHSPASSQSSQFDIEARYAHLLNPIRDLAKNWNIDLSSYLGEYLADLVQVELTFDNGKTTMNFAQAALLIQGSACVYSKKVEYLYNLASEILKVFGNKKHAQQNNEKHAGTDTSTLQTDPIEEFLALDDIEVDKNLNKKDDDVNSKSKKAVFKFLSRTPTVLTPSEQALKGDIMLYNRLGDLIGNKNDFQINISKIHSSGLLVIDTTIAAESIDMTCPVFEIVKNRIENKSILPGKSANINDELFNPCINNADSMHDDICPSPASSDCCDIPRLETPVSKLDMNSPPEVRRSLRIRHAKQNDPDVVIPVTEPLKLLDPHAELSSLIKPVKKLRRCLMIESLELDNSKPKRKKTKIEKTIESVSQFCSSKFTKRRRIKCRTFKEFETQYWEEIERRKEVAAKKNAKKSTKNKKNGDGDNHEDNEDEISDHGCDFDDDGCDEGPDLDNIFDDVDMPPRVLTPSDDVSNEPDPLHLDEEPVIQSYEELVRNHVDNYMSSANNFAQLSDLSKRVKEWEEKIKPRLDEEDRHVPYDIHVYGSQILNVFNESKKQNIPFVSLSRSKPKFEVCRLFLASLQLANSYNVEISSKGPLESGVDTMELKILSTNRHHEELQDYRAPSII